MIHERGNLRFTTADYHQGQATCISVKRISDGHWLSPQAWWEGQITEEELAQVAQEWEAEHGAQPEPPVVHCASCGAVLTSDHDTEYQFDNALWIGLHGGYGMFVDNLDAKLPTNTEGRWLLNEDGSHVLAKDEDGKDHPVEDPEWGPEYSEQRVLPGTPDYEVVLCHECAHALWEVAPWLERLITAAAGHGHTDAYWQAHPGHEGWDKPATCCGHPFSWHYDYDKQGHGPGCAVCACAETKGL